ncbi:hypothetical protein Tco_1526652 [Tanacetum coccineum]
MLMVKHFICACLPGLWMQLTEVAESPRLSNKIKVVFHRALGEEKAFGKLMQDLCFSLSISLSKKRRLVDQLDALVLRGESAKPLEYMREVVARDSALLGYLEKLLAHSLVGVSLKECYWVMNKLESGVNLFRS